MTLLVRISEEADAEMADAARWYEMHRAGLGTEFLDAVDTAVARIAETPGMGSPVPGVADQSIRRRPVRRFPYHVVYMEISDRLQILGTRPPPTWVLGRPASQLTFAAPSNGWPLSCGRA